jgi:hypothetical protein
MRAERCGRRIDGEGGSDDLSCSVEPIPMTLSADEHDELCRLEESLWRAETRFDRDHMNEVLAPDFFEFGQSGRVYRREDTLDVPAQPINATLPLRSSLCD